MLYTVRRMAAGIDPKDKCPRCGAPYMSTLAPGEDPASRYCYTCSNTTTGAVLGADAHSAADGQHAADDELALQPLPGETLGGPRRGRLAPRGLGHRRPSLPKKPSAPLSSAGSRPVIPAAQTSQAAAGSRAGIPAAQPGATTGSRAGIPAVHRPGSRTGIPAAQPAAATGSRAGIPEPLKSARGTGSRAGIPAAQPGAATGSRTGIPAAHRPGSRTGIPAAQAAPAAPAAADGLTVQPLAVSPNQPPPGWAPPPVSGQTMQEKLLEFSKANAVRTVVTVAALIAAVWAYKTFKPFEAKNEVAAAPEAKKALREERAAPERVAPAAKTAEPKKAESAPAAAAKAEEKPAQPAPAPSEPQKKTDVVDLLNVTGPRKAASARVDDDEPEAKTAPKTPAATTDAAGTPATAPGATPEKKATADAADVLGLKKKDAQADDAGKPPAPLPVTATEPTIVPLDLNKLDGGMDRDFTMQLNSAFPGWRCKDVNATNCAVGLNHRGRPGAMAVNPVNDVLPAKLIANIEIPPKLRPRLLIEISSKDGSHDWLLTAKLASTAVFQSISVKMKDPNAWQEVPLDLSAWAGKRVEVILEVAMKPKTKSDKYKEQLGYFRNIRLDWPGKDKAPAPQPKP